MPTVFRGQIVIANALGAWLGGLSVAAGHGWTSTGWVGALLAAAGIVVFAISVMLDRELEHDLFTPPAQGAATGPK